ncbi:MAG: type I 3-dehydroquinate dehydratase, partial [Firmicutes bacterium]|nr:type I 3-dehydroquinate dehydratase [Bacillota bacterium]
EARLRRMEDMGGDIAKIAVMPQTALDVAELLAAAAESREKLSCPVVAISMGGLGVASRMVGQIFGSAITFGTVGNGSAPGQLPVGRMKEVLTWIHEAQ